MKKNVNVCSLPGGMSYGGFTVMPGFLYGISSDKMLFVSNGKIRYSHSVPYFQVYVKPIEKETWEHVCVTEAFNFQIFYLIEKGIAIRERKGIEVKYLTSSQLEEERWKKDENHRHFPCTVPYKSTCHIPSKYANSEAKFKASREKKEMVERLNTTYHNTSKGNVMVI